MKTKKIFFVLPFVLLYVFTIYAQNESNFTISPAQIAEREIDLKDTHIYEFSLDAGEFVRFKIQQKNVEPKLIISDSGNKTLRQMYIDKVVGKTAISFIAAEKGKYRLTLKPSGESEINGIIGLK